MSRYSLICFSTGTLVLLAGALFYAACRQHAPALVDWVLTESLDWETCRIDYVVTSFPSFAHACGFTLLSAACCGQHVRQLLACATCWFLINVFFEVLTLIPKQKSMSIYPGWFDYHDIFAALLGAIFAVLIGTLSMKRPAFVLKPTGRNKRM